MIEKGGTVINAITKEPLRVSNEGTAGPFIRLPASQIEEVSRLLKSHNVRHWVQENIISLNNGPFIAIIDLGHGGNQPAVQAILDSVC